MPTPDSRMMATEAPATNGWTAGSMRRSYEPAGWNLCDVHHLCCTCCVFQTILSSHEEALLLARVQFGLNIAFHILFPSITIGLAWVLVYFRLRYEATRDAAWLETYRLWVKVFALSFAMGVVTGVVMSFQFGTNWPGYMNKVGNIAGPLLAYEVLTAFLLEATFLAVMLFGMNRVPGWMHVASAAIVAFGTTVSAFWILALNSWMHTPAGYAIENGALIAGSWWEVIFNPSFPFRFVHMLLASGI